ncbi:MAG: hypothetical protein MJB14_07205 [Spirochaetes bacterium]|nr:hypothetical protein [Spirochaetota bacterium]
MNLKQFYFLSFLIIFLMVSCKTTPDRQEHSADESSENNLTEKINFEFINFSFQVIPEESQISENNFYSVPYQIDFLFQNKNANFTVDLEIYDQSNKVIYQNNGLIPERQEKNQFLVKDKFTDLFLNRTLRFRLIAHYQNKREEYSGEYTLQELPYLDKLTIGPIISQYKNNVVNTGLLFHIEIKNTDTVEWIKIIPPSQDKSWNAQWKIEEKMDSDQGGLPDHLENKNVIVAKGSILDSKHFNYIENGEYIIQINFGTRGIIQQNFTITDLFNNEKGPNYGIPIVIQKGSDKNSLFLEVSLIEKLDYMEFHLFDNISGVEQKIGVAKIFTILEEINKKELKKMFYDDFNNQLKLKNNKDYYYQVYLYSKEFNGIKYISISKSYKIVFQGFSLFGF